MEKITKNKIWKMGLYLAKAKYFTKVLMAMVLMKSNQKILK